MTVESNGRRESLPAWSKPHESITFVRASPITPRNCSNRVPLSLTSFFCARTQHSCRVKTGRVPPLPVPTNWTETNEYQLTPIRKNQILFMKQAENLGDLTLYKSRQILWQGETSEVYIPWCMSPMTRAQKWRASASGGS